MDDFLPKGYEVPKTSGNYFKFEKGVNHFRILSGAITGYLYWTKDNKPVRQRQPFGTSVPEDAREDDGQFKPKHFWAFIIWNYDENKVQIMEITQQTIQTGIEALVKNPRWGSPTKYDLSITATGDKLDREYTVVPEPPSEAPKVDISNIYLEELFGGGDPFNPKTSDGKAMPNFDNLPPKEVSAADFPDTSAKDVRGDGEEPIKPEDIPF